MQAARRAYPEQRHRRVTPAQRRHPHSTDATCCSPLKDKAYYAERYQHTKRRLGRQRGPKLAQIDLARKLTEGTSFDSAAIARPARALLPR
jgi:hypothetical protein